MYTIVGTVLLYILKKSANSSLNKHGATTIMKQLPTFSQSHIHTVRIFRSTGRYSEILHGFIIKERLTATLIMKKSMVSLSSCPTALTPPAEDTMNRESVESPMIPVIIFVIHVTC